MKNNKINLVCAILYMTASLCFIFAAVFHTETATNVLSCVAGISMLISSIGFFYTYVKNKKSEKISKDTESLE